MNLEKLQLKELSELEMREVTGGSFWQSMELIKRNVGLGIFDYGETIETSDQQQEELLLWISKKITNNLKNLIF